MGYAAVRALFLIGAIAATSGQYFGKDLGALSSLHHGVRGNVYAVDSRTLYLKDFQYDGEGPAAYFYVGSSKTPNSAGAVRLRDERGNTGPLRRYRGEGIALSLPDGKTLKDFKWFSVWCDEFSVNFGDVSIPRDTVFPRPSRLAALHGAHNVNSDPVVVVDAQTLLIPNFSYDGEAPDAKFWVGRGEKPSPQGIRIPDENGKEAPLRRYDKKTIVLTLPGELTVFDIGYFSVWCEAFTVNFGHVVLPAAQLQNVPPSLKMLGVSPQSKLNCEVLYDELAFEVRWAVAGDSIVLQLVAKLEDNDYMSFGISGDSEHSQMVGGDVAVAWVNKDTLKGYVYDYFLDAKSQCAGTRGSCPDEALGAKTNSVRLLNAALVNGYSIVTYQRSLKAADGLDKPIFTNMSQPIIWGLGPLNSKNEVSYHHHFTKGDRLIDFGRAPVWNCPMPEGEEEQKPPQVDHSHKTDHRHEVNRHSEAKPSQDDHYQTHEIKPNPVPAPKPVPKAVPWEIPAIQCYEPPDGVLYAQMGPTGGKQGYSAITGHVGWGISWYINGLLIPEINVVRGKKYTFVVEGGTNPEIPAKYHPFYITNDSVGGYYHKSESEKQGIEIYAGVRRTRSGEIIPTGVGRLCNWTPDNQGPEADEYPSFGAYQRSLTLVCDQGNPGVVTWTPDKNTPDTVYYQCFTHRHLGWKINVVDSCDVQEPEESRVVEVVEPSDLNQEESLQVESRINSNSNFLDQQKKVEKIINTNKSNYDNFSSNKAGNYGGGQDSIQPYTNVQEYDLPVSKGQIKNVIEAVESIESQMQDEARKNLTQLSQTQYLVHENNNEQSLLEQPIIDNEEYVVEHSKAPGSHFLPASYKPHTLQSVLRINGQRPVGPIRPPNRRPTPPEIKLRRPHPPPSMHEGYNNRNNFFIPHNQNHNHMHQQKKTYPQKYPSRMQAPNHHNMHNKPNSQVKNNIPQYHQSAGHLSYKAPHRPINTSPTVMGLPSYKINSGPVNHNQNLNKGDPEIVANQVVKSQILLPGVADAEVQQSVQSQSFINRPDQIILGKPIENPAPLDQQLIPNKQFILNTPITPPTRHRYQTTTPKIENFENVQVPSTNSDQPEIQSSDFLGHQVETSSFSPAVNTGFKPDTVVIESGFKPIIREPLMDRTDQYRIDDERLADERQLDDNFTKNLKNPNRRVDADIEDYVEASPQYLSNTNFNSNNKVTETFEPMFIPSPEDHSLNTEPYTDKTKEVFPANHAKEDRPHPVYTPTLKSETTNLFTEKKTENEMSSDMQMDSDRISPQYLPPETPKEHTPHSSKTEETYTTYDGKTVSAATLTSIPETNNYDDEFFLWKLPRNSEKLLKTPQLGPFRGEIPPSSDLFLEDSAATAQSDRRNVEASADVDTSNKNKPEHKLKKRMEEILPELKELKELIDEEDIYDSEEEEKEVKRKRREVQTTQYEENNESTTSTTQQSFTNGHMHHTEYESPNKATASASQLYLVLLVLGIRYI